MQIDAHNVRMESQSDASPLAEKNHKPIGTKEGKRKSGRIKTRCREEKYFACAKWKKNELHISRSRGQKDFFMMGDLNIRKQSNFAWR